MNRNLREIADRYSDYGDERVRTRPNPKANRPRTKIRPQHEDAEQGMVIGVDRGRYQVIIGADTGDERTVTAARARELRKTAIVTGDQVRVVGDTSGTPDTLARIVEVLPRKTLLRRSADDTDKVERVMVANADQMLIVVAAMNPEPRVRLVDRYLVAAYDAGIKPLLVITKTDLTDPTDLLSNFTPLDIPVFLSGTGKEPTTELAKALADHTTVFVGHSGVGKSTLMNALIPDANRAVGHVNEVTGRGRHTSSSSSAMRVRDADGSSGWIIDTPGVRSFGLGHVSPERVIGGFQELSEIIADCPRGCSHTADTPDCALDAALADDAQYDIDAVTKARIESLRRLLKD